jgi:hypothetical protein
VSPRERILWRWAPWVIVACGVAVLFPALGAPFWRDDLLQRAMALGGFPAHRGPTELYDFVRPGERAELVSVGALPWWTDDALTIRFFRPLSSSMLWLEYRSGLAPLALHVLSFAWWAAAVFAASRVFARVLPNTRGAIIATAVFAVAPCHVLPLAQLAQREVLVSLTFGSFALLALLERRLLLAAMLFSLSLAAGEYGLCVGGYVLPFAIGSKQRLEERARVCASFAGPAAVYLVVRALLGYGAAGTGFYRDPIHSPAMFAAHAPRSLMVLVADAWSTFDADAWPTWALVVACLVVVAIAAAAIIPENKWLVVGAFLALAPLVASAPGVRLIGFAMLGVAAAVASLVDRGLSTSKPIFVVLGVGVVLLALRAPYASAKLASATVARAQDIARRGASLSAELHDHAPGTVVVPLGSWEAAYFGECYASATATSRPPWRVLVNARHALMLRTGARVLDVVVPKGQGFFPIGADNLFRPEEHPLREGDERDVPGMHVLVISDGTHAPPRVRFTFDRDLDDASLTWLTESVDRYRETPPPAIGFGDQLTP